MSFTFGSSVSRYATIEYTDRRNKRQTTKILARDLAFYAPYGDGTIQWILRAYDVETGCPMEVAMCDIHSWRRE
jgi:hypothetical protein